jgi:hypothetical protein
MAMGIPARQRNAWRPGIGLALLLTVFVRATAYTLNTLTVTFLDVDEADAPLLVPAKNVRLRHE